MTAETTIRQLPVVCCVCKRQYKTIDAHRDVRPGEASHGYCPECLPKVEAEWFGKKVEK